MNITRRDALLGATAAAVTVGAPIAAPLANDPVIDLAQQLRAASMAWFSAIDAFEDAALRVGYNERYYEGPISVETSDGTATWGASEIRQSVEDGQKYHRLTPEQGDAALAEIERRKREGRY